jgi:hypothetical protein
MSLTYKYAHPLPLFVGDGEHFTVLKCVIIRPECPMFLRNIRSCRGNADPRKLLV